jgi:hypothetical protein
MLYTNNFIAFLLSRWYTFVTFLSFNSSHFITQYVLSDPLAHATQQDEDDK